MHLVTWLLYLTILLAFLSTSHSLPSGAEEAFHTVEIHHSLGILLLFLLDCMHLILLLGQTASVVTEPTLLLGT